MPKISVIIPVYNVEQYLPQCLDSLRKQTLSDLEFICINDGSVDGSLDILQAYAAEDHRFVIINQKNRGMPATKDWKPHPENTSVLLILMTGWSPICTNKCTI